MNKYAGPIFLALILIAIVAGAGIVAAPAKKAAKAPIASATYMCEEGRTLSAAYFDGSVELSIDGAASTTLPQAVSGSGARFANADESLVFWNKGNEALIMRDNAMDINYRSCTDRR